MKKVLQTRRLKRTLTGLLAFVMIFGSMPTVFGSATDNESYEGYAFIADDSPMPFALTDSVANQNYRNLNMTPGGNVDEMRFTWHSQSTSGSIRLYESGCTTPLRTTGSWATQALTSRSANSTWFPDVTPDYTVHQVILTGLTPQTDYEYVIVGANFESTRKPFRTGGSDNFSFLVGGDPQIGVGVQHQNLDLSGWTNTLSVAMNQAPNADFFLSVGDQVHTNTNNIPRSQYMYDILFTPTEFHSLPMVPVVGNHEAGVTNSNGQLWHSHYNTLNPVGAGNVLGNTRRHGTQYIQFDYYVRWGNMIMIVLDSNTRTLGGQRLQWFESVLETHTDAEWRVVTFHHPPYSVYRSTTDGAKTQIIQNWIPEFQRLEIDIVLSGHCHSYSRSHQMINNVPQLEQLWISEQGVAQLSTNTTNAVLDPTGIVYMAFNSASGSGYYNVTAMANRHYIADWNQNFQRNFSVVDVTPTTFTVSTYQVNDDSTTTLVDVYTIVRSDNGQVPAGFVPRTMGDRQLGTFLRVEAETIRNLPLGTTVATIEGLLPAQTAIETDIHTNDGGNPTATRNPGGVYGIRVKPLLADITWDLNSITPSFDPYLTTQQTYTIRGVINNPPNGVGGITPPITVYIEVIVGFDPPRPFDGYVSYFGARYRFYGRSHADFLDAAFDPAIFSTWTGGEMDPLGAPTPIGFGAPVSLANVTTTSCASHFSGALATVIPTGAGSHQRGTLGADGNPGLHTFTYFARTFYLPENFSIEHLGEIRGAHHIDDNLLIFINGIEVYRMNTHNQNAANIAIGYPINWNTYVGHNTDARFRSFHINSDFSSRDTGYIRQNTPGVHMFDAASRTNLELALQPGQNVLTAVVGQNSANSSDLWFDLELYLEYVQAPLAINFNANNGTGTMQARAVQPGDNFDIPQNTFTRSGHEFTGWNTAANGSGTAFAPEATILDVQADITLFAQWIPVAVIQRTITFNANGGTGTMPNGVAVDGTDFQIPANAFTRSGYEFTGWSTTANGPGTAFTAGALISNVTADMTLFAQWSAELVAPREWLPAESTNPFVDVPNDNWQNEPVSWAVRNGIATGIANTEPPEFRPNTSLNRETFATFLHRVVGTPEAAPTGVADNASISSWVLDAVEWGVEAGIILGFTDNTFRPQAVITREQIATMLFRFAEYLEKDLEFETATFDTFPDSGQVRPWALEAMQWATHHGLIMGVARGGVSRLEPQGNATRAQAVAVIYRFVMEFEVEPPER